MSFLQYINTITYSLHNADAGCF